LHIRILAKKKSEWPAMQWGREFNILHLRLLVTLNLLELDTDVQVTIRSYLIAKNAAVLAYPESVSVTEPGN